MGGSQTISLARTRTTSPPFGYPRVQFATSSDPRWAASEHRQLLEQSNMTDGQAPARRPFPGSRVALDQPWYGEVEAPVVPLEIDIGGAPLSATLSQDTRCGNSMQASSVSNTKGTRYEPDQGESRMLCRKAVLIGAIVLVLLPAACAAQCDRPADPVALDGSRWVLTTLNGISVVEGSNLTLRFAAGRAAGLAGINRYSGEYVAADEGTLTIREIQVNAQLCQTPQSAMPQEDAFIEALQNAAAYRVMGDHLEIENAEGETTLVFTRIEEFPMGSNDLVGTDSADDR